MRVRFASRRLAKEFNSEKELVRAYGRDMAKKIMNRMAVLEHAHCLADVPRVPPERCHALTVDRHGQFSVDLVHPRRLVFAPDNDPVPTLRDGSIDLNQVTEIVILEVVDYH